MGHLKGRRGPVSAVTDEMLPTISSLHAEGHCVTRIAEHLGIRARALYPVMKRMGLEITRGGRRSGLTKEQISEMANSYLSGETTESLAERYGVFSTTISRYLRSEGIEIRPAGFQKGEAHHAWNGGRITTEDGYVLVLVYPDDPFYSMGQIKGQNTAGRYVLEHRLVMARHLGRPLTEDETVHHKDDRDRQNNDISNLQLRRGNHGKGSSLQCSDCGSCNIVAVPLN